MSEGENRMEAKKNIRKVNSNSHRSIQNHDSTSVEPTTEATIQDVIATKITKQVLDNRANKPDRQKNTSNE
jgi:hypothetical protein